MTRTARAQATDHPRWRQHHRPHDEANTPLRAADKKRSVENILQWNSYLPPDCVRTMVRMGWDYPT